jgi:hypothetical protein
VQPLELHTVEPQIEHFSKYLKAILSLLGDWAIFLVSTTLPHTCEVAVPDYGTRLEQNGIIQAVM